MVIETKTIKNQVESPDSIPSMADTSVGSSHSPIPTDYGLSPRQLFAKDKRPDSESHHAVLDRSSSMTDDEVNTEVEYGSEASITSSETTAVASWNRSHIANATTTNSKKETSMMDDGPNQPNHESFRSRGRSPAIIIEEPLEESVSCHGPLTTRQLAELLGAFQSRAMGNTHSHSPSTADKDQPPPPPPMTPREELLLRERAALKKIIQDDSVKIINLRSAMEAQRGMNTVKDIEIEDKEFELQIALDRIDALKKEKEVMREREDALMQTIQILKTEVDKLSKLESRNDDKTLADTPHTNSIGSHHLLHDKNSDVHDHEDSEYNVNSLVESIPFDNEQQDGKAHSSTLFPCTNINFEEHEECPLIKSSMELVALTAALEDITKRLDAVEKRQQDTEFTILEVLAQKNNFNTHEIGDTVLVERHDKVTKDLFKVSQNTDEVEVVLLHDPKKKVDKSTSSTRDSFCCWDTCSDILCDIF